MWATMLFNKSTFKEFMGPFLHGKSPKYYPCGHPPWMKSLLENKFRKWVRYFASQPRQRTFSVSHEVLPSSVHDVKLTVLCHLEHLWSEILFARHDDRTTCDEMIAFISHLNQSNLKARFSIRIYQLKLLQFFLEKTAAEAKSIIYAKVMPKGLFPLPALWLSVSFT